MDAPSMVQRDGDKLIVRRVVSGEEVFLNNNTSGKDHQQSQSQSQSRPSSRASYADSFKLLSGEEDLSKFGLILEDSSGKSKCNNSNNNNNNSTSECAEQQLPQCKIKRNYSCSSCTYFTQNPRKYLTHLRDVHGEKIIINECKRCLYASRHYQKLVRHMKMVHGSTDGIKTPFSSRRRGTFRKEFFKKNKFKMNNPVTPGGGGGVGGGGSGGGSGASESQYSLSSANYINQLMKSNLSKMFSGVNGGSGSGGVGAGDSSTENSLFFPGNFKPVGGLTLAEQAQQLSSQLKGSSNINIFTDNGGTSSQSLGDSSVNNDVLAMLQHNLVDKGKQLTITAAGASSSEMASSKAKKRPRPIPDLIPLHSISQLHLTGEAGKTYHLNPEVTIKTRVATAASGENNNLADRGVVIVDDDDSPINLTADHHQQQDDKSGSGLQHQCIFCQIMVRTTDDLALHLRTFHSDELFALLLQKKPEDSGQVEQQPQQVQQPSQLFSAETLTIDIWKRLLENNKAILEEQEARENDSEMQSGQFSNDEDDAETVESAISKNETYCGVETAPGYGEVTSKINLDGPAPPSTAIMKKVFKCPHCSFWASTASRFHVHIVGHLNKKPFECSLCAYRSNWRWDITKHIRLKTIRDPSHKNAGVLMNDETGRRNYTKYNRYITLMKVTDNSFKDASSSSKAMMLEANQADYLAMCKAGDQSSGGSSSSLAGPASTFNTLAKMYSSEELAQAFNLANMNQMARYEPEMLQSLMAGGLPKTLPPTDDDSTAPSAPKVAFKCKKCNFKNPFREMVLLHIKSTHLSGSDKSGADAEIDLCEDQQQHDQPSTEPNTAQSPAPSVASNNSTHNNNNHPALSPLRTTSRPSSSSPGVVPVTSPRRNVVGVVVGGLAAAAAASVDNSGSSSSGGAGSATAVAANTPPSGGGTVVGFPSNNYTTTNATTLIGVGLNLTQAVVANDNRLGTTSFTSFSNSNSNSTTIPTTTTSVVSCGGEVDSSRTIGVTPSNTAPPTPTSTGNKGTSSPPTSSNASSWRPSAPYRCGHCHQVSNWKHVIQRHCRLKHNGNVLIEMVNTAKQQQQNQQPSTTITSSLQPNQQQQQPATGNVSQNVTDLRNLKKVRKPFQSFDSVSQDITVQPVTLHPIEIVPEVSLVVQEVPMVLIPMVDGGPPPLTILSPGPSTPMTTSTPMTFINLTEESSMELPPLVRTTVTSTATTKTTPMTSILPTPMQTDTSDNATEPEPEPEVVPSSSSSSRTKRYQCPACPYVTDSKTQFAYHKSFHKPRGDPYQCSECSYNVTKKHLLIQHQKTHTHSTTAPISEPLAAKVVDKPSGELSLVMGNETKSSGLTPAEILDLTKKMGHEVSIMPAINNASSSGSNSTGKGQLVPKIVYYCKNCPARYLDESEIVIHQNKHHQQDKYKCDLCSFSTYDESGIANHRNVHGLNYRIVTAELRRHNVESESHPRPKTITIRVGDDRRDKVWVVKRDYEALQPPELDEPILVEDPVLIEEPVPIEEAVLIEEPVLIEDPVVVEEPVLVEDPVPATEPMQVEEEPAPAPPTPPPKTPPPPPPPALPKEKDKDPPRIRRSARVKQPAQEPTKRGITKKPPHPSKQTYSCDHCDHVDTDEAALKDHVKFHFRDILFPRRVDGVEARRGTFRQKVIMAHDPEHPFELRYSDEEDQGHESGTEECPEEERIFIEI